MAFAPPNGVLRIETCGGSLLLDCDRSLYCRADRGTAVAFLSPWAWRPFHSYAVGDEVLVRLLLDERGTSVLSAWVHTQGCAHCGVSLDTVA